jgi:uncharacterized damage-inducible protein DinB
MTPGLSFAIHQIAVARTYTLELLNQTDQADWFRQPAEGVSHIGWQATHLAVAQYWLALNRVRGQRPEDEQLISESIRKRFGRESSADPDPANNPAPADIRAVLDRVHQQTLTELPTLSETDLDQPVSRPHRMFETKRGAVIWCAQHEFLHAGQIGLIRRLLGYPPVW